jgi:hypothetical protein
VTQVGAVTTIAFSAATTAALNTNTTQPVSVLWSLSALVNGQGPFQLVARRLTIYPVGTAKTSSTSSATLAVTVGSTAVSLAVTLGGVNGQIYVGPPTGGSDTATIQAALDSVANSSFQNQYMTIVQLGPYTYNVSGLVIPMGVHLRGNGTRLQNNGSGWMIRMGLGGAGSNERSRVSNLQMHGGGSAGAAQGIQIEGFRCEVSEVNFDEFAGRFMDLTSTSGACLIDKIYGQNGWRNETGVVAPTGGVCVAGNDHYITNSEITVSKHWLTAFAPTPEFDRTANGYFNAWRIDGNNHFLSRLIGELSDQGFYMTAANLRCSDLRADLNTGSGFLVEGTASGSMTGCHAISPGAAWNGSGWAVQAANTYDGFSFANNSKMLLSACRANKVDGSMRYGFYDLNDGNTNFNQYDSTCFASGFDTAPILVQGYAGSRVSCTEGPFLWTGDNHTTLNVQQFGWPHTRWSLGATGPISFTDFTNEVTGMVIYVEVGGAGTITFVHNTSVLRTTTGANKVAVANTIYKFISRNGVWFEF